MGNVVRVGAVLVLATLPLGCVAPPPDATPKREALGAPIFLQILVDGATVTKGATDNYYSKTSQLAAATSPAFDPTYVAPQLDAATATAAIARRVNGYFAPYNGSAQTGVLGEADIDWIVVGGVPSDLTPAAPNGAAGIAPLDCGDVEAQNGGWVFSDTLTINYGGLLAVAATIAHELGHMRGLEHTQSPTDLMYASQTPIQTSEDLFAAAYGSGAASDDIVDTGFRCGSDATIDNHQRLLDRVGAAQSPGTPPTLTWTGPSTDYVPYGPITIDATADDASAILEVWRGFELYAVLDTAPPWHLELPSTSSDTYVTLDAWVDRQHSHETRHFHAVPVDDIGPPPDLANADLGTPGADLGSGGDHGSGCRVGARAPIDWSSLLIIWSTSLIITRSYRRSVRG